MANFDINKFDINKNYVLEASAGTGKTYNIVEIIKKLVKDNIPLEKILIVTYTEKAAGELKERIRKELVSTNINNAHIGTIHSFCKDMLREFAVTTKQPLNLTVIDEDEIEDFIAAYIREGEIEEDIIKIKKNYDFNVEKLIKIFKSAIKKYYLDLNGKCDETIISALKDEKILLEIAMIISTSNLDNIDLFNKLINEFNDIKNYFVILEKSSITKIKEFAENIKLEAKNRFKFNGRSYQLRYFKQINDDEKKAFIFFKDLKDKLNEIKYEDIIVDKYLSDLYIKWQEYKAYNKVQTFNDMIRNVRENVLHNDEFCNKLKAKFTYAIIDEFQDTNQIQFDIFKKIFIGDDKHHIIVVGDPKQSIYSFQGADIDVYYHAKEEIGIDNCYVLGKNYRSTASMVDTCNKLFEKDYFKKAEFISSKHLEQDAGDKEPKAFYDNKECNAFWVACNDNNTISVDEFADIAVEQIVDCCTYVNENKTKLQVQSDIGDEKTKRNVSFKDFAILARTRSEMNAIINALKKAGIPFVKYKDNDLFLGKECSHWIALLEAVDVIDFTGNNRNKFKKALFTNFFGYELVEINNPKFEGDDNDEMELLNKWKEIAFEGKWEYLFDDIIVNSKLLYKMSTLKEKQSLAKFKQISDYCIDYLSEGNSLKDLIRILKKNNKNDIDGDGESAIIKKNTDFDSVQIMTIHASKGLEFPVVIVAGGFREYKNRDYVFTLKKDNKRYLTFDSKENNEKAIEEFERLFYVAYTRAKYVLILPYYEKFTGDFLKNSLERLLRENIIDLRIINNIGSVKLKDKVQEILLKNKTLINETLCEMSQNDVLKKIINNESKQRSYKHSYTTLSHSAHSDTSDLVTESGAVAETNCILDGLAKYDKNGFQIKGDYDANKLGTILPLDFPRNNIIGTILHEVFEKIDYTNYNNDIINVFKQCFKNQTMELKDDWIEPLKQLVYNVLNAKLPLPNDEYFQLKDINNDNKIVETEFNFNKDNEYLKNYFNGFIDLIVRNNGRYVVVDWKTDSINDVFTSYADAIQLKKHVDEKYSIQRTLYAYCLIKWLKLNLKKDEDTIFKDYFGGIYYIFLRGCEANYGNGVYCHSWNNYKDLEKSFNEIVKELNR